MTSSPLNPAAGVERLPLDHVERDWLRLYESAPYLDVCPPVYRPPAELLVGSGVRIAGRSRCTGTTSTSRAASSASTGRPSTRARARRRGSVSAPCRSGPRLLDTLRDLRARSAETHAHGLTRVAVFTMPVRVRKGERGRWGSSERLAPMDRNIVSRDWHNRALEAAGLRDMPLHALRHTAAASWLLTGHPLIYVQRQLGHASITTTESFYGHLEESFLKSAPAATEAAIRDAARLSAS